MIQATSSRRTRPFNSPLECGLRLLFVLAATQGRGCDLQRLIAYDYLLVHSGDVEAGPVSLHPAVPFRGSELLVKRALVQAGLDQMFSRELLSKTFDPTGISYRPTDLTTAFANLLTSEYADALRGRAHWVVQTFGQFEDAQLADFMSKHIGQWGAEFDRLVALNDLEL